MAALAAVAIVGQHTDRQVAVGDHRRGLALGIWSAVSGVGVGIGLTLAGFLVDYISWRAIFWVNAPFLLAVIVIGRRAIRDLPHSAAGRGLDLRGAGYHADLRRYLAR